MSDRSESHQNNYDAVCEAREDVINKNKNEDGNHYEDVFVTPDEVCDDLIECYQIQIDNEGPEARYIGSFKNVPLIVHTTINYDQNKVFIKDKKIIELDKDNESKYNNSKYDNSKYDNSKDNNKIYKIHVVTYVITKEDVAKKLYKIVGLMVQTVGNDAVCFCSLELRYNSTTKTYEYIFCDHISEIDRLIDTVPVFPGVDKILPNIVEKIFEDPILSLITS